FGERDRLVRTDRVLKELGSRINGTVPGSLFCGAVHNGTNVHIQAGLPGVPWFRVGDSLDTREAWRALLRRAMTAMLRLHDAVGLALSVPLSQGRRCPLSIRDCITDCLRPALRDEGIAPAQTSLLFMHHLLWRINQCHGLGRRAPLRVTLLDWVDQFVDAPGSFISRQLR